jgi:hypothetical protein
MDVTSVATQLISALAANPELMTQFSQHPYSTTAQVTGSDESISQKDMNRVLTQVAAQATGQNLGLGDTKSLASALLGQNGGSVHALASALFGGAGAQAGSASGAQGMSLGGFDLGGVMGALTGAAATPAAAAQAAPQAQGSTGPSMAEIAAKSIAGAVAAQGLAALITGAMSSAQAQNGK